MEFLSPAKINLFLAVTGKRPDGYHELCSLFCRVGIYDRIDLVLGTGNITVSCPHPDVPEGPSNLAHKAATVFAEKVSKKNGAPFSGVHIRIEKIIPVGAGLGGGSSNAATVLMALNNLLNRPFSKKELLGMGIGIGADVPFFIFKKPAIARGIGEKLTPYHLLNTYKVVLVNPAIHVSTKEVYKNLNLGLTKCEQKLNCLLFKEDAFRANQHMCNDLEMVTESLCPEIPLIKGKLSAYGARGALMTGSGPTVFGLFSDEAKARYAYEQLSKNKRWAVFLSELLV